MSPMLYRNLFRIFYNAEAQNRFDNKTVKYNDKNTTNTKVSIFMIEYMLAAKSYRPINAKKFPQALKMAGNKKIIGLPLLCL